MIYITYTTAAWDFADIYTRSPQACGCRALGIEGCSPRAYGPQTLGVYISKIPCSMTSHMSFTKNTKLNVKKETFYQTAPTSSNSWKEIVKYTMLQEMLIVIILQKQ